MPKTNISNRYSHQINFKGIGKSGQEKLARAKITIVGMGGLGSVIAMILSRAGVGYLRIIDRDIVEANNLHRQVLFDESDIGKLKADASAARLKKINSAIKIEARAEDLGENNAEKLLSGADIILDGTDNMETRMLINKFAIKNKVPFIYGSAVQDAGMAALIIPGKTACLSCLFPKISKMMPMDCGISGVIPTITALIGTIEANEAIKHIAGFGESLAGKLFYADISANKFEVLKITKDPKCSICKK